MSSSSDPSNDFTSIGAMQLRSVLNDERERLRARSQSTAAELTEARLMDTADLIARLAEQSLRQERMLLEEQRRSADLEFRLAKVLAVQSARSLADS